MKELDLLLERFMSCGLDDVAESSLSNIERLLESPDQDLLAWLNGASAPADPDLVDAVAILRTHVAYRQGIAMRR